MLTILPAFWRTTPPYKIGIIKKIATKILKMEYMDNLSVPLPCFSAALQDNNAQRFSEIEYLAGGEQHRIFTSYIVQSHKQAKNSSNALNTSTSSVQAVLSPKKLHSIPNAWTTKNYYTFIRIGSVAFIFGK